MTDARVRGLLLALPSGEAMWLSAAGRSLWPFLRGGDSLRVQRCAENDVMVGDIVVIDAPHSLVAHIVVSRTPLTTASSAGVRDAPAPVLARVIAVRRAGQVWQLPRSSRHVLRLVPGMATVLKRLPLTRRVARWLRD